jgi:hypothetical protein
MICPNCHQQVSPGATFCGSCGFKLNNNQPASTLNYTQPTPNIPPQVVTPVAQIVDTPVTTGLPVLQPVVTAAQPSTPLQPVVSQPAYDGATGAFVDNTVASSSYNTSLADENIQHNSKGIIAFVLGVLGCIGWLIPLVGVTLGVLALVFGTIALKSKKKVFAIIGIALAVPVIAVSIFFWVRAAQSVLKSKSTTVSGLVTKSTSSSLQTVTTPCYTTKIPTSLTMTKTANSCTFDAVDNKTGQDYEVKVLQVAGLSPANLHASVQTDAQNIVNITPGSSIASQKATTFAGSPAYLYNLKRTDGSAGILDYIFNTTLQGNLVIIFITQNNAKSLSLSTIENNWSW